MSSAGEGEATTVAVEQPPAEAPVAEKPAQPEKPVKEKKVKAPKEKKAKASKASHPAHPPYFQMIKEALLALHEKSGSSPYAIAKYMEEKHKAVLPANFRKILALQLKNCVAKGKLIKIKASFKLSESGKKEKVVKGSKVAAEKKSKKPKTASAAPKAKSVKKSDTTPKKAAKPAKKVGVKKAKKAKKATPARPKQPKSIKSPAAKKSRKAAA
ncbi:PREDICTED: histone H1-like [Nelumbo nucifera]|uniref:Histone H1-like n=1 Tax=Nelumbo nucifera TaxID=4432 RepID=A0A1U8A948_NELNU|nr:PREDICTED: histone H1-like [Nelumbo nucifera]